MLKEKVVVAVIALVAVVGPAQAGMAPGWDGPSDGLPGTVGDTIPATCGDRLPHPPIRVTENAGLDGFVLVDGTPTYRPGSGVTGGLGTADDPYVIEGLCIDGEEELWSDLMLAPEQPHGLVIAGTDAHVVVRDTVLLDHDGSAIRLSNAENVVIENTTATRNGNGIFLEGTRESTILGTTIDANALDAVNLRSDSDDNVVRDNTIIDNARHGVNVRGSSDDNRITANAISGNQGQGARLTGASTGNEVTANTLDRNENGVFLAIAGHTLVHGNEITGSSGTGVTVFKTAGTEITGNTITGSGVGIALTFADNNLLEGNTVSGNEDGMRLKRSSGNLVQANTVADNQADGLELRSSSERNRLTDNAVTSNDGVGLRVVGSSDDNVVSGNTVARNGGAGLFGQDLETPVDARDNWWGDGSGPSGGIEDACTVAIADGTGEAIAVDAAEVCFDPWLTNPNPDAGAG